MTGIYVMFVLMATSQAEEVTFNTDGSDIEKLESNLLYDNKAIVKNDLGPIMDLMHKMHRKINLLTDTVKLQGKKIKTMEKQMDEMKETIQKQSADIANYEHERQVLNKTVDELYMQMRRKLEKCRKEPYKSGESDIDKDGLDDKISEHTVMNSKYVDGHRNVKLPASMYRQAVKKGEPHMLQNVKTLKENQKTEISDISVMKRLLGQSATTQPPTKVAFSAYLTHTIEHMGIGHTIKLDQVYLNDGNSYNTFTGIFTVPTSGVYLLTFTIDSDSAGHSIEVALVVDNVSMGTAKVVPAVSNDHFQSTKILLIRLNAGQSVWLQTAVVTDSYIYSDGGDRFTTFSGVLLYQ